MADIVEDSFAETGAIVTELVAKAAEARAAGASRRAFFAGTAKLAGATALGAAGIGLIQPLTAATAAAATSSESFQDIINIAATAERVATTFYINALEAGSRLPHVNSEDNRDYFQAALIQEAEHLYYLYRLGAKPTLNAFYFPDHMFTDESVFFPTASLLEDYFISAYIAAAQAFSGAVSSKITAASPFAIGFAVQVAGVESEHRVLIRDAASLDPPNNRIVETALLTSVSGALVPLAKFLKGGAGFTGPFYAPTTDSMNRIAQPFGFSFFPKFTIV
jgi:rubrerythrin